MSRSELVTSKLLAARLAKNLHRDLQIVRFTVAFYVPVSRSELVTSILLAARLAKNLHRDLQIVRFTVAFYALVSRSDRALDLRNLGPKFGPIPKAKKYVFFPILDENFPI